MRNKDEKIGNKLLVRLPHNEKQHHEVAVKTRVQEENWKKGYTNTVTIVRKQNIAISQICMSPKQRKKDSVFYKCFNVERKRLQKREMHTNILSQ